MPISIYALALEAGDVSVERLARRALTMFGGQHRPRHLPEGFSDRQLRDIGLYRDRTDEPQPAPMPSWRIEL